MRGVKKLFRGYVGTVVCRHNAVTALHSDVNIKTNEATQCTLCLLPYSAMCLYIDSIPCAIVRNASAGNLLSRKRATNEDDARDKSSQASNFISRTAGYLFRNGDRLYGNISGVKEKGALLCRNEKRARYLLADNFQ